MSDFYDRKHLQAERRHTSSMIGMSKPNRSTKTKNLISQERNETYGFHRRGSREAIVAAPERTLPPVDLGRRSWWREIISCLSSVLLRTAREGKGGGWKKRNKLPLQPKRSVLPPPSPLQLLILRLLPLLPLVKATLVRVMQSQIIQKKMFVGHNRCYLSMPWLAMW